MEDKQAPGIDLGHFSEPALLILASLAGGPKHGYAMVEDIARLSHIRLRPTTLYAALARLEQRGLVESLPAEERRRPYRLTEAGAAVLREQLQSMERFAAAGLVRLAQL
jgi:DNA-binding PadR family transcriptional regulator